MHVHVDLAGLVLGPTYNRKEVHIQCTCTLLGILGVILTYMYVQICGFLFKAFSLVLQVMTSVLVHFLTYFHWSI